MRKVTHLDALPLVRPCLPTAVHTAARPPNQRWRGPAPSSMSSRKLEEKRERYEDDLRRMSRQTLQMSFIRTISEATYRNPTCQQRNRRSRCSYRPRVCTGTPTPQISRGPDLTATTTAALHRQGQGRTTATITIPIRPPLGIQAGVPASKAAACTPSTSKRTAAAAATPRQREGPWGTCVSTPQRAARATRSSPYPRTRTLLSLAESECSRPNAKAPPPQTTSRERRGRKCAVGPVHSRPRARAAGAAESRRASGIMAPPFFRPPPSPRTRTLRLQLPLLTQRAASVIAREAVVSLIRAVSSPRHPRVAKR
mmetsp:Transcript_35705/g.57791  ORF Transcript_35705/g.57791 Transcript_35705/m.57791 type:complete len:312 (+) Transcript_35705:397-1332(+)